MTWSFRDATPEDALAVARVHVRSWQVAYRGLIPDAYLDAMDPADRAARYTFGQPGPETILIEDDRGIGGFATVGPARDDDSGSDQGEVMAIYLDPPWWGTGAGRVLMAEARRRLVDRGFATATLWVLAANHRACSFYRRDGWRADGGQSSFGIDGQQIPEIRYRRRLFNPDPPANQPPG